MGFEVLALDGRRLYAGSRAQVAGRLAGRAVEFEVTVVEASAERLALAADGPISVDVQYLVRPAPGGSDVRASVSVEGRGVFGRVLAGATEALLAAGALRSSLERLGRQLRLAAGLAGLRTSWESPGRSSRAGAFAVSVRGGLRETRDRVEHAPWGVRTRSVDALRPDVHGRPDIGVVEEQVKRPAVVRNLAAAVGSDDEPEGTLVNAGPGCRAV